MVSFLSSVTSCCWSRGRLSMDPQPLWRCRLDPGCCGGHGAQLGADFSGVQCAASSAPEEGKEEEKGVGCWPTAGPPGFRPLGWRLVCRGRGLDMEPPPCPSLRPASPTPHLPPPSPAASLSLRKGGRPVARV